MSKIKQIMPEDMSHLQEYPEPCYDGVTVEYLMKELDQLTLRQDPGYDIFLDIMESKNE